MKARTVTMPKEQVTVKLDKVNHS